MRVTLLSDAHLRSLDDPRQRSLVEFLRNWDTDEWIFAGDIFDAWWGWDHTVHAAFVPLLAELDRLRLAGTPVTWLGGNHDFAVGGVLTMQLGVVAKDRWTRTMGGRRMLVVHGDEADNRSGYRWTRRLLRGPLPAWLVRLVGPDRTWRWALQLSAGSRAQGASDSQRLLLGLQAAWADQELAGGADVVCMGHSHAPGVERRDQGLLVNLGDWAYHRSFLVLEEGTVDLFRWQDGEAVPLDGEPAWRNITPPG